jgi:hypothetical protein
MANLLFKVASSQIKKDGIIQMLQCLTITCLGSTNITVSRLGCAYATVIPVTPRVAALLITFIEVLIKNQIRW